MVRKKQSVAGIRPIGESLSRTSGVLFLDPYPTPGDLMTIVAKVREKVDDINRDLDTLEARLKERESRR